VKHYPHHIGDFDRATRHLTRIERSIYRDLIDLYYDTEQALTLDREKLCRRILARSNEESTAVEQVLNEFFTETPTGWYHVRCEEEIEAYRANTSQKAMAGKASAEAKRLKKLQALNGNSTVVEQPLISVETDGNGTPTNHQPSTINHQPITKKEKKGASAEIEFPDGLDQQAWTKWVEYRKKSGKALKPVSYSAAMLALTKHGLDQSAVVEQSIAHGWQGLFGLKSGGSGGMGASGSLNRQEAVEARNQRVAEEWLAQN
jgi:uncharacterized protein YdaU (DUF1376 family)